jgi:group I intron endonuclease
MAVIYRITNMANGKFYIGSAESFARREWQHKYALRRNEHKNPRLQAAWNKYGEEMFVFEVIEEIAPDRNAFDVENTYLHKVVGKEDCYNINTDAIGMRTGIAHTEASKAKVSASRKGKAAGEDHYRYGQTISDEVRQKIGDTQRGKPKGPGRKVSEAGKAKIRANIEAGRSHMHWLGRTHTEEAKQKLRKQVLEQTSGQIFDSLTAVLTHYQMTMPTLRRALVAGKPITKGKFVGLVFVYA